MSIVLESSVVRIYNTKSEPEKVVGAGFLVSHKHIITCAHVVCDALSIRRITVEMPTGEVSLDFPLLAAGQMLKARVVFWRPVNSNELEEDIAALELENPLPNKAQPVLLVPSENVWGHPFKVFGFPKGQPNGVWASGVLRDATAKGWVQLEDVKETGLRLEGGFSGGLVWDQELQLVAGMAVAAEQDRREAKVAFIIPANLLLQALIEEFPELDSRPCPYRGLSAFREEDAQFFFGREDLTRELVAAVQDYKIVPAIGPSGSGKSSAVFAGLIPQLRSQQNWLIEAFRPKTYPFNELARALLRLTAPEAGTKQEIYEAIALAKQLKEEASALETWVSSILENQPNARLLLVADQFEEIFKTEERQIFLQRLLEVVKKTPRLTLLFTMRADFMENALSDPILAEALDNDVKVKPMSSQQLQDAIEKPARGLVQIESGLTTRILEDALTETSSNSENDRSSARDNAGYLPLVEFALEKLWEKQEKGRLTHQAYEEIAGVKGAIAQHADRAFKKLGKDEKRKAQQIFIQLVHPGENNLHTRQIATRSQLGEDKWSLVTYLAGEDCRLVVTNRNEVTKEETVELIHEALIREWQLLGDWIQDNRKFRIWQEQLRVEMRQWKEAKENKDAELLRKAPLTRAEYWFQERGDELSQLEKEFIRESVKRRDRDRRRTILGLVTGLVTVSMFAVGAVWQWRRAVIGEKNAQMQAEIATLDSRFASDKSLDSLIAGIKLGKKINNGNWWAEADTFILGSVLLQKMVYGMKEYNRLEGHSDWVYAVDFSPTDDLIVSGSKDGRVKLWGTDGTEVDTLKEDRGLVRSIAFSPDGNLIAAGSSAPGFLLWKKIGDRFEASQPWEGASTFKITVFSPDGNLIALSGWKGIVELWDTQEGTLKRSLTEGKGNIDVESVAFSPDGEVIASADREGIVRLWKTNNGKLVCPQPLEGYSVAFTPNGQLMTDSKEGVKLWNSKDCKLIRFLKGGIYRFALYSGLAFSPTNDIIASGDSKTVQLWKLDRGLVDILKGHNDYIWDVAYSRKGDIIASASSDGTVKLWKPDGNPVTTLEGSRVVFSPNSNLIASRVRDSIQLWKYDGSKHGKLKGAGWPNNLIFGHNIVFSHDGKLIASVSKIGIIKIWKTEDLSELPLTEDCGPPLPYQFRGKYCQTIATSVAFSHDSNLIATASADSNVIIWSIKDRQNRRKIYKLKHDGEVTSVAFSPKGNLIASASHDLDNNVKLWNSKDGRLVRSLEGHRATINQVVFSPNGNLIASASGYGTSRPSRDDTIKLWNPQNGNLITTLVGHTDGVNSIAFHPKEKLIASASRDKTVKIWKLDGTLLATLEGHESKIASIAFSNDGRTIASAEIDGKIILWNLNLDDLLINGCDWVRDYLNTLPDENENKHLCNDVGTEKK